MTLAERVTQTDAEIVGVTIRNMRRDKGMSQDRLASRARLSQAALSNYERGKRPQPMIVLRRIAKALGHDNETAITARASVLKGQAKRAEKRKAKNGAS